MGQYFMIVNKTKKEFIYPSKLDSGIKLWEIAASNNATRIFPLLLRQSSSGGGGDIRKDFPTAGRWAGDRIIVVGDYDNSKLYDKAEKHFKDISKMVVKDYNEFIHEKDLQIDPKKADEVEKRQKEWEKELKKEQAMKRFKKVI